MLQHGQITDAPVYMGNHSLVGLCEEFDVPEMETKQIEHETLGSVGILVLPARGIQKLQVSMTMSFPEPEFMAMTMDPTMAHLFQLHSKLDIFNAGGLDRDNSTTLVTIVNVMFAKPAFPAGKRGGEAGKFKAEGTATRVLQRDIRSETPIVELDLFANIHNVMGKPVWPD